MSEIEDAVEGIDSELYRSLFGILKNFCERVLDSSPSISAKAIEDAVILLQNIHGAIDQQQSRSNLAIQRLSSSRATDSCLDFFRKQMTCFLNVLGASAVVLREFEQQWCELCKQQIDVFVSELDKSLTLPPRGLAQEDCSHCRLPRAVLTTNNMRAPMGGIYFFVKWPCGLELALHSNNRQTSGMFQRCPNLLCGCLFLRHFLLRRLGELLAVCIVSLMPPSPVKLRGKSSSLVADDLEDRRIHSISVSDINDVEECHGVEVITTDSEAEMVRDPRREEEEPMTKERRLAFKQLERWRAAMKIRSRRLRKKNRWGAKTQAAYDEELEFDNLFGSRSTYGHELQVVSYPWPLWIFGTLIMIGAAIFANHINGLKDDIDLQHADWWKYLVAGVIFVLGFFLAASGRVETFYMNKEEHRLVIRSNKPLCLTNRYERVLERDMHDITNIRVEASGDFSGDVDTRSYKIHIDFNDGTHASAIERRSKQKTLRRCRLIKSFAANYPAVIAPIRSASERFQPVVKVTSGSPLRHAITAPSKLRV